MANRTEADNLHSQGLQAREAGDFRKALELVAAARVEYAKEGNWAKFAETLAGDFLTYRHLYDTTGRKEYLVLAKYSAKASVELAEMSGDKTALAIPLFNLAKAEETLGELKEAVNSYHEAVEALTTNPPASHNRPGVLADFKVHMTTCEYMDGDKTAYERALTATEYLAASDEMDYNKHVWLSGAHMRMANMLAKDQPEKAKEHLLQAKKIIDADDRLVLRKKQLEKLEKELGL